MSILLCMLVIFVFFIDPALITEEIMFYWALFSIADALWVRNLIGGNKNGK